MNPLIRKISAKNLKMLNDALKSGGKYLLMQELMQNNIKNKGTSGCIIQIKSVSFNSDCHSIQPNIVHKNRGMGVST